MKYPEKLFVYCNENDDYSWDCNEHETWTGEIEYILQSEYDKLKSENEKLREALHLLNNWVKAYPADVFPEPDLELARKLLTDGGVSYGDLNAYSMRHVINGVARIIDEAIKCEE